MIAPVFSRGEPLWGPSIPWAIARPSPPVGIRERSTVAFPKVAMLLGRVGACVHLSIRRWCTTRHVHLSLGPYQRRAGLSWARMRRTWPQYRTAPVRYLVGGPSGEGGSGVMGSTPHEEAPAQKLAQHEVDAEAPASHATLEVELRQRASAGQPLEAEQLFYCIEREQEPTADLYEQVVWAYANDGDPEGAGRWLAMLVDAGYSIPGPQFFKAMLHSYQSKQDVASGEQVAWLDRYHACGHTYSVSLFNTLLRGYARYGLLREFKSGLERMFSAGLSPNGTTHELHVLCLLRHGDDQEAEELFESLRGSPFLFSARGMDDILRKYASKGDIHSVFKWYDRYLSCGHSPSVRTFQSLIKVYTYSENIEQCEYWADQMQASGKSWNRDTCRLMLHAYRHQMESERAQTWRQRYHQFPAPTSKDSRKLIT